MSNKSCKTCGQIDRVKNTIKKEKKEFKSMSSKNQLERPMISIDLPPGDVQQNITDQHKLSVKDLISNFDKEHPKDKLIRIPVVMLQDYNQVPYSCTVEDFNSQLEYEKNQLEEKTRNELEKITAEIEISLKFKDISKLTEMLLPILVQDYCECNSCIIQLCQDPLSKKCSLNNGKKKENNLKNKFEKKIKDLLNSFKSEAIPLNKQITKVHDFCIANTNFMKFVEPEIKSINGSLVGRNHERKVAELLEKLHTRGLLINGFKVKRNLKKIIDAFNIKFKKMNGKEVKEVEHDFIHMEPKGEGVKVSFTQSKAQTATTENKSKKQVIKKACEQLCVDIETFSALVSYFLTDYQFHRIDFKFSLTLSSLDDGDTCEQCMKYFYSEQNKNYTRKDLNTIFHCDEAPSETSPTDAAVNLYKILAAIYVGGGSLVELKESKEAFPEQKKHMDMEKENYSSRKTQQIISHNKTLRLSKEQANIYLSEEGLNGGFVLIGNHGTGKSINIKLEIQRAFTQALEDVDRGTKIFVVVWETKAEGLIQEYENFAKALNGNKTIQNNTDPGNAILSNTIIAPMCDSLSRQVDIQVFSRDNLCHKWEVDLRDRDTTSVINELCGKFNEKHPQSNKFLVLDEVEVINPQSQCAKDLIGKAPFILDGTIFHWSELDPQGIHLVAAVTADCQDLSKIQKLQESEKEEMKKLINTVDNKRIPTVPLWRVFRYTKNIAAFVQYVGEECTEKHRDFGYTVGHTHLMMGHEIDGYDKPLWIPESEAEHMLCGNSDDCSNCFLIHVEESMKNLLNTLEKEGIDREKHICIVVSYKNLQRNDSNFNKIKEQIRNTCGQLEVKVNFELEGLERPVVVILRNRGGMGASISHGMSRATDKLVIIGPDDEGILDSACEKGLLSNSKLLEADRHKKEFIDVHFQLQNETKDNQVKCWHISKTIEKFIQTWKKFEKAQIAYRFHLNKHDSSTEDIQFKELERKKTETLKDAYEKVNMEERVWTEKETAEMKKKEELDKLLTYINVNIKTLFDTKQELELLWDEIEKIASPEQMEELIERKRKIKKLVELKNRQVDQSKELELLMNEGNLLMNEGNLQKLLAIVAEWKNTWLEFESIYTGNFEGLFAESSQVPHKCLDDMRAGKDLDLQLAVSLIEKLKAKLDFDKRSQMLEDRILDYQTDVNTLENYLKEFEKSWILYENAFNIYCTGLKTQQRKKEETLFDILNISKDKIISLVGKVATISSRCFFALQKLLYLIHLYYKMEIFEVEIKNTRKTKLELEEMLLEIKQNWSTFEEAHNKHIKYLRNDETFELWNDFKDELPDMSNDAAVKSENEFFDQENEEMEKRIHAANKAIQTKRD